MKLHTKLCIAFSAILLIAQLFSAVAYYGYEKTNFEAQAIENLTAMGEKIIQQYEEYVQVMDYTLESLLANVEFMEAMATLSRPGGLVNPITLLESQSVIPRVLYREPLNKNYYRVNMFNRQGDFFTSRFDNRDTVSSVSFDMPAIVASIPWLDEADSTPFSRLLIAPYRDVWTYAEEVLVFGAGRSVLWLGNPVGYLEVQAPAQALEAIFSTGALSGVRVLAMMPDGQLLYESQEGLGDRLSSVDTADARWAKNADTGAEEFLLSFRSEKQDLSLLISQDAAEWRASMNGFVRRIVTISIVILAFGVFVVTVISMGLTRSVRRLERRIDQVALQGERIIHQRSAPDCDLPDGDEIRRLEQAFDALIARLNASMQAELHAQALRLQAHYHALQAQINPHFMYNTLNMIAAKALEIGSLELVAYCERFADMLRYSTDMHAATASVADELRHVRNYLELVKARYEQRLRYTIDVPEALHDNILPRVSLQPLVENCILHGYRKTTHAMDIHVWGEPRRDGFCIRVRDNGDGFSPDALSTLLEAVAWMRRGETNQFDSDEWARGIGMLNTLARMYYCYDGRLEVSLRNDDGAVVELCFSLNAQEGEE